MTKQERSTTRDAVKLRAQAERGRQANDLLNHPLLVEGFDVLEQKFIQAWKDSSSADLEVRDNAYKLLRLLSTLRSNLKAVLIHGNNAKVLLTLEEIKGGSAKA